MLRNFWVSIIRSLASAASRKFGLRPYGIQLQMKMKLIIFGLAFVAFAAGEQYLPPNEESVETQYLPPSAEAAVVQPDNQYLAPVQEVFQDQPQPENEYLPPIAAVEPIEQIAEDGYRYKTVKRIRYRTRRDVSELTSGQYIPPAVEDSYGPPPSGPVDVVQESAVLADDGYRYKTVKRVRHRNRRDVNELASAEYLPPVQQDDSYSYPAPAPVVEAASVEIPAPVELAAPIEIPEPVQESAVLADDGYQYKTVRRIRYRHRRDVSELPTAEYLPPVQQDDSYSYPAPAPVVEAVPVEIPAPVEIAAPAEESAVLADDGYRYKTVRRIRYRHRRDVNELPTSEYLPPVQQDDSYSYPAPVVEAAPVEIPAPVEIAAPAEESSVLVDDGYRYKTVRRIRYRHRRDVNELTTAEYLPPVQQDDSYSYPAPIEVSAPIAISAPIPIQQSAELADDGYRYKTVKKYKIKRH